MSRYHKRAEQFVTEGRYIYFQMGKEIQQAFEHLDDVTAYAKLLEIAAVLEKAEGSVDVLENQVTSFCEYVEGMDSTDPMYSKLQKLADRFRDETVWTTMAMSPGRALTEFRNKYPDEDAVKRDLLELFKKAETAPAKAKSPWSAKLLEYVLASDNAGNQHAVTNVMAGAGGGEAKCGKDDELRGAVECTG